MMDAWKSHAQLIVLAAAFTLEWLALSAFQTPNERFTRFAYCDSGADFTIQSMINQGLKPTLDFGYIYGLVPLAINRAWQGMFGANPGSFRALLLLFNVIMAVGLARLATTLRVKWPGILLLAVAMPDMLQASTIVLVHALEPALLINALAFQAKGRRDIALALATTCLFVKPAMAFVYGFTLLVLMLLDTTHGSEEQVPFQKRLRSLLPAMATGSLLALLMAALYGVVPLFNTLVPGAGLEVYRQNGYGFFRGAGRDFWWIPGGGLRDYLRYEVGAWIACTITLIGAGIAAVVQLARRKSTPIIEIVFTTAFLHVIFVTLAFGNRVSWVYYYPILIVGLMALSVWGRWTWVMVLCLAALIVVGIKVKFETSARSWKEYRATVETFGLWATPSEREEWIKVEELCRGKTRASLLANVEGLAILNPSIFMPPTTSYLVPGHPLPAEIRRKANQIAAARMVVRVRSKGDPLRGGYERWPEIAEALKNFETIWEGELFEVQRHRADADTKGDPHSR